MYLFIAIVNVVKGRASCLHNQREPKVLPAQPPQLSSALCCGKNPAARLTPVKVVAQPVSHPLET